VLPKTGRTHQIRVHLAHISCPVLCDKLYSGRDRITRGELTLKQREQDRGAHERRGDPQNDELILARQALHAARLALVHPATGERLEFVAPLAVDMQRVLDALQTPTRT
jgi:23S rRNA pseudouridine1911/1915/1917 synthase